ncbi:Crp/Fnr family transcriptional regulator [Paenibacillus senegalensis]|uniref:Crp/Fnr family transcriptional regulator n=1 Tax=Paenibacillus senegalensis TaxID=1465766 RepID=UPI0002885143|nr:Crp/Fnr family transcriptional regulator [Paenibacillus senegalensis]
MILNKGETLFRQGEKGPLYRLRSGLLKIVRVHEDGSQILVNIILPEEIIPHHSLISPNPYFGTAVALIPCEIEVLSAADWYQSLQGDAEKLRSVALLLQDKLRMMQQRIDQLTEVTPANRLRKLQAWFQAYTSEPLANMLTQDEIGQFLGLRRETVNRLMRAQQLNGKQSSKHNGM